MRVFYRKEDQAIRVFSEDENTSLILVFEKGEPDFCFSPGFEVADMPPLGYVELEAAD